jgi:dystonin
VINAGTDTQKTPAKGRTNIELREQFILADGVSQSMTAFKPRVSISSQSPQNGSPIPTQGPIMKVNFQLPI